MTPRISNPQTAERLQLVPRKVLVVDEDVRDLHYYSAILRQQGYEVRACASYAEGALCLKTELFDFIVVSQGSRAFEGRSVLERAIEISRRTPVVVLTACLDMGCYLEAMQLGAVDYVEKPVVASEIARLLETHLRPRSAAARTAGAA